MLKYVALLLWTVLLATHTCEAKANDSTIAFSSETTSIVKTSPVAAAPIASASTSVTNAPVTTVQPTHTSTTATVSDRHSLTTTEQSQSSSTTLALDANVSATIVKPASTSTAATVSARNSSTTTEQSQSSSTTLDGKFSVTTVQPTHTSTTVQSINSSPLQVSVSVATVGSTHSTATTVTTKGGASSSTAPAVNYSGTTAQSTLATATAATSTIATTASSVCSPGYCKNSGRCSLVSNKPTCDCSAGFGGKFCESFVRFYKVTFAANNESGVPMAYDAIHYGSDTQQRKDLGTRLCHGVTLAMQGSPSSVFNVTVCSLVHCYPGSLMAELITMATFHPSVTALPNLGNVTKALKDGISERKEKFCNASSLIVDYGNPCNTSSSRCSPYATCNSTAGIYSCACSAGYADGNDNTASTGTNCTQLCTTTRCPGPNQYCQQRPGQPVLCQCSEGFTGPLCTSLPLSRTNVGLIVGNALLVIIALAALLIYCLVRRNRRRSSSRWQPLDNEEEDSYVELNSDSISRL